MLQNVQPNWNETDSTSDAFIKNKPTIPAAQVQADWDESDSSDVTFIKNKPSLATVATTGSYNDLSNKPTIPDDPNDYLCFKAIQNNFDIRITSYGNNSPINIEYSFDKKTWNTYTIDTKIYLENKDDVIYWRGDNDHFSTGIKNYNYNSYYFKSDFNNGAGGIVSGNIMSLLDSSCKSTVIPTDWCFYNLFSGCSFCLLGDLKLPALTLTPHCYEHMFINNSFMIRLPVISAREVKDSCFKEMFKGNFRITEVNMPQVFPNVLSSFDVAQPGTKDAFREIFSGCSALKKIVFFSRLNAFAGIYNPFTDWLNNVPQTGAFECMTTLNISTRGASTVPAGWTIVRTDAPNSDWSQTDTTEASYIKNRNICAETTSSDSTYTVNAGVATTPIITVASALTLDAGTVVSGKIAYAEVVIDLASNATVTAGSNITFVDTLTAGKRNVCVVRWSGGTAKLYVTIVEDLDESASN